MKCHRCGYEFPEDFRITRSAECPQCNAPVRVCKNCRFYAPGAHWDCRETIPEPVLDKERSNFCDYFKPASSSDKTIDQQQEKRQSARKAFDDLFS